MIFLYIPWHCIETIVEQIGFDIIRYIYGGVPYEIFSHHFFLFGDFILYLIAYVLHRVLRRF